MIRVLDILRFGTEVTRIYERCVKREDAAHFNPLKRAHRQVHCSHEFTLDPGDLIFDDFGAIGYLPVRGWW